MEVVISALTIIEAAHRGTDKARLAWILSGARIVHIDAAVAEAALRQRRPVVMLTSEPTRRSRTPGTTKGPTANGRALRQPLLTYLPCSGPYHWRACPVTAATHSKS